MGLKKHNTNLKSSNISASELPDIPKIPEEIKERNPKFREYEQRLEEWWYAVRTVYLRHLERLEDQIGN